MGEVQKKSNKQEEEDRGQRTEGKEREDVVPGGNSNFTFAPFQLSKRTESESSTFSHTCEH